ncbi:MAG: hypothetical protein EBE86_030015 [Hormoscilla sp. GUM202]|nr:hypothetical protein [Hormoscilla sp. GUM202]
MGDNTLYHGMSSFDVPQRGRATSRSSGFPERAHRQATGPARSHYPRDIDDGSGIFRARRWLTEYRLEDIDIIGRSHYEVFPEIPSRWKEIH